jgi:hypothetical protein
MPDAEATKRIVRVLGLLDGDLTTASAPWFPGKQAYAETVVAAALGRLDQAFGRWRDLFTAAEQQRDAARRTMDNYALTQEESPSMQRDFNSGRTGHSARQTESTLSCLAASERFKTTIEARQRRLILGGASGSVR